MNDFVVYVFVYMIKYSYNWREARNISFFPSHSLGIRMAIKDLEMNDMHILELSPGKPLTLEGECKIFSIGVFKYDPWCMRELIQWEVKFLVMSGNAEINWVWSLSRFAFNQLLRPVCNVCSIIANFESTSKITS